MKLKHIKGLLFILNYCLATIMFGQTDNFNSSRESLPLFTLKGDVQESDTFKPIPFVNIEIMGGGFTKTNGLGEFRIRARIGDELILSHSDFETVRYVIKDKQRIRLEVNPVPKNEDVSTDDSELERYGNSINDSINSNTTTSIEADKKSRALRKRKINYIDIARSVYKKDLKSGVENATSALEEARSNKERAEVFNLLGTIYTEWRQYDLAIDNYKQALEISEIVEYQMGLAKVYFLNKQYRESIAENLVLKSKVTTDTERLLILEQLADAYKAEGNYDEAIANYRETEQLLKEVGIEGEARISIKIGEVYDLQGASIEANKFYDDALDQSESEDVVNAARTKLKVADIFNKKQSYGREIDLRNEALSGFNEFDDTLSIPNDDILTSQKQNYKIANALIRQQKIDEAIPYFEKSIDEAAANNDLVVEKDATRKLSELYRDRGDYDKATESYERFVALVDKDYALKQQEIGQAERRAKIIAENQNRILSLEKDRDLNESRYQLALNKEELATANNTKQNITIVALAAIILLLLLMVFISYRGNKRQKYVNNMLALRGLRSQMNPHFIFNALNSVNSFIATSDERKANAYLSDFSKLMRSVLENSEEDFIPLSSEIDLIKKYTMLEHFRFKDKFDYELIIDDDLKIDDFHIPPMLLQPYVENAVWHGLRYKEEKGKLDIYFGRKDSNTAVITITDDGVGRTKSKALKTTNQKKQRSKGMGNIKKRIAILNEMYDDRVAVQVEDVTSEGEGTRVTLLLKK